MPNKPLVPPCRPESQEQIQFLFLLYQQTFLESGPASCKLKKQVSQRRLKLTKVSVWIQYTVNIQSRTILFASSFCLWYPAELESYSDLLPCLGFLHIKLAFGGYYIIAFSNFVLMLYYCEFCLSVTRTVLEGEVAYKN